MSTAKRSHAQRDPDILAPVVGPGSLPTLPKLAADRSYDIKAHLDRCVKLVKCNNTLASEDDLIIKMHIITSTSLCTDLYHLMLEMVESCFADIASTVIKVFASGYQVRSVYESKFASLQYDETSSLKFVSDCRSLLRFHNSIGCSANSEFVNRITKLLPFMVVNELVREVMKITPSWASWKEQSPDAILQILLDILVCRTEAQTTAVKKQRVSYDGRHDTKKFEAVLAVRPTRNTTSSHQWILYMAGSSPQIVRAELEGKCSELQEFYNAKQNLYFLAGFKESSHFYDAMKRMDELGIHAHRYVQKNVKRGRSSAPAQ